MTIQLVALIKVEDQEKIQEYRNVAGEALAKHEGRVAKGSLNPEALEAAIDVPDLMAVLEFPTIEKARAWREDPTLKDVHALRNSAGKSTILVLPN